MSCSSSDNFRWSIRDFAPCNTYIENLGIETQQFSDEIELDSKNYLCSISFLSSSAQIVLTLHDVTEIMRLSTIKKDFVVNVSHELRTPLTAIKGFVETLEEEGPDQSKRYLDIIKRHTERLISIVKDLQLLSELEAKEKLELSEIKLSELLAPIVRMFEPQLTAKGLNIKLDVDNAVISVDAFKFEQVFINLLDNSIKYTEKGKIKISAKQDAKETRIIVEDTGIGIPKEHIPRIFERFYVADKSHSRKMGGTGLGLSIVKHIIQAHGGSINIESEVRSGTRVIIELPRRK